MTPKDYAGARRAKKVREKLTSSATVTEAIYDAGFNSSGRFYEKSTHLLGMTPRQYRAGGTNEEIKFAVGQTSLDAILVAWSKKGVAAIVLGHDPDELVRNLQDRFKRRTELERIAIMKRSSRELSAIESPSVGLDLPLDVRGTAFQQRVWQALREILASQTVSYAEIARRIGSPKAERVVAGACAANNLAVAIPCRRVVRNDGALSGYAWGVDPQARPDQSRGRTNFITPQPRSPEFTDPANASGPGKMLTNVSVTLIHAPLPLHQRGVSFTATPLTFLKPRFKRTMRPIASRFARAGITATTSRSHHCSARSRWTSLYAHSQATRRYSRSFQPGS